MQKILSRACSFQSSVYEPRRDLFRKLGGGQHPETCLITCVDSRICTQLLTGAEPGELFVIRNAGNLVPPQQWQYSSEAASIEIAISVGVRDIIVCGHSDCGAMKGLFDPKVQAACPSLGPWLANADETRKRVEARHPGAVGQERVWAAVQENVLVQLENLRALPCVVDALQSGSIQLHGWVYSIESGEVLAYDLEEERFAPLNSSRLTGVA